jgi:hypothetical protein
MSPLDCGVLITFLFNRIGRLRELGSELGERSLDVGMFPGKPPIELVD